MNQFQYQGWIKVGMNGIWQPWCLANTVTNCLDVLHEIRPTSEWSELLVLPYGETPFLLNHTT